MLLLNFLLTVPFLVLILVPLLANKWILDFISVGLVVFILQHTYTFYLHRRVACWLWYLQVTTPETHRKLWNRYSNLWEQSVSFASGNQCWERSRACWVYLTNKFPFFNCIIHVFECYVCGWSETLHTYLVEIKGHCPIHATLELVQGAGAPELISH